MRERAASPSSALTSQPTVSMPASTQTCAMPAPIVPSPTTPTFRTSRGTRGTLLLEWRRMAVTVQERKLLVDGEWVETGSWKEIRSPFSGEVVGRVAEGGADEARSAVDAAARAMAEPLPAHQRADVLRRTADLVAEHHDQMARTISTEAARE